LAGFTLKTITIRLWFVKREATLPPLVGQFGITALDRTTIRARLAFMCFKITLAQREYYHYQGIPAELERRGYGSSRAEFAWAIRQKQHEPKKPADDKKTGVNPSASGALEPN
jgi:hypothetical protein